MNYACTIVAGGVVGEMKPEEKKMTHKLAHQKTICLTALCLTCFTAQGISIVPTGLNPGDQYRLAFVTDGARDATPTDVAVYNAFVQAEAEAVAELAALGATWSVIGSTEAVDARDNTGTNPSIDGLGVRIYNLGDEMLATGNSDLWDGSLLTALVVTPSGGVSGSRVLTGAVSSGEGQLYHTLGHPTLVRVGYAPHTNSQWIDAEFVPTTYQARLYGMSSVLTVPNAAVPDAGATILMLSASLLGLLGARRRIRA